MTSPSRIQLTNLTSAHEATNATLDFDITTVNSTLRGWSVEIEKDGSMVKTFAPSDPRGPGTATGSNPVHVRINWDGLDNNNQPVTGNITWVTTANTTNFVAGGNLNDGVNSVQATTDDSLDTDLRLEVYENKSNGKKLASSRHTYGHIVPGDLRDELDNVCADPSIRLVLSGVPGSQTTAVGDFKVSLGNGTDKPVAFVRKGGAFEAILDLNALASESAERSTYHVVDSSFPPNDANEFATKLRGRGFSQVGRLFDQNNPYDPSLVLLRSQLFGTPTFDDLDAVKVTAKKVAMAGYQTLRVHHDPHNSQLGLAAELEAMLRVKRQATALYVGGHGTFTGLKLPSVAFKQFGEFQQELFPGDWAHLKVVIFGACTVANLNNYQNNPVYQRDGSPEPVDQNQNKVVIPLEQIPSYSPARLVDAATNHQAVVLGYSSTAPSGPGILQSLTQLPYDQQILQDYFIRLGGATVDQVHDSPLAWLEANAAIDFFDNACAFDKEGYYYIDYRIRNSQGWFRTYEEHYDRTIVFVPRSRWDLPLKADHRPIRVKKLDTVYLRVVPK